MAKTPIRASYPDDLLIARNGEGPAAARPSTQRGTAIFANPLSQERPNGAERPSGHCDGAVTVVLANGSVETVLQPIVDLRTGRTVGAEALSRFSEHPSRPPAVWFAEATSVGLGVELEVVALRSALDQLSHVPSDLFLSLNASIETIISDGFHATFSDIPADRIVLELTTEVHDDCTQLDVTIGDLRSHGLRLAASVGRSNLRHILNLRPDIIKLDPDLIRGIEGDHVRQALVSALLGLGTGIHNVSFIAQGIETDGEFETLRALGCPFGQGFYLGRPGTLREHPPKHAVSGLLWLNE